MQRPTILAFCQKDSIRMMRARTVRSSVMRGLSSQTASVATKETSNNGGPQLEKPPPRKFDKYRPEIRVTDLLERESPLLSISGGKAHRPPFLRRLFIDKFDERMLTYPEVLTMEQAESLDNFYMSVKRAVDALPTEQVEFDSQLLTMLQSFGLFGAMLPKASDLPMSGRNTPSGLGLTLTEFCRVIEAFARQPALGARLISHNSSVLSQLKAHGSCDLHGSYSARLASGEWLAAYASHEATSGVDPSAATTTLRLQPDEGGYVLNGQKTFVTNGAQANLFLVICRENELNPALQKASWTSRDDRTGSDSGKFNSLDSVGTDLREAAAVLVERDTPGVHVEPTIGVAAANGSISRSMFDLDGAGLATVTFDNVQLSREARLSKAPDHGLRIALDVITACRCPLAALVTATAREAMAGVVLHAANVRRQRRSLVDLTLTQHRLASMAIDVYVAESLVYLTTAVADVVHEPDYALEAAATRAFALQAAERVLNQCAQVFGASGTAISRAHAWRPDPIVVADARRSAVQHRRLLVKTRPTSQVDVSGVDVPMLWPTNRAMIGGPIAADDVARWQQQVRALANFEDNDDMARFFIAMSGLQLAGQDLASLIERARDPLRHPLSSVLRMFQRQRDSAGSTVSAAKTLDQFIHPSLIDQAAELEFFARRLAYACERALEIHGAAVMEQQVVVQNLADVAVDTYAAVAAIGRASRSYCIGLRNSDHEILLAKGFVLAAHDRIVQKVSDIESSVPFSVPKLYRDLADQIIDSQGYAAVHPTTGNI